MRKLQVTEFPKRVYRQIEAQALLTGHSVEDEIRMRLVHLYSGQPDHGDEVVPASMRWRKEVGGRLTWPWHDIRACRHKSGEYAA